MLINNIVTYTCKAPVGGIRNFQFAMYNGGIGHDKMSGWGEKPTTFGGVHLLPIYLILG